MWQMPYTVIPTARVSLAPLNDTEGAKQIPQHLKPNLKNPRGAVPRGLLFKLLTRL